jgi:hypothetical protein
MLYENKNKWIWHPDIEVNNQYVDFIYPFQLDEIKEESTLNISINGEYIAFINGEFVACNQYHDYPDNKIYDSINIAKYLYKGINRLCITAYYQGVDTSQYIKSTPALLFEIVNVNITEMEKTMCRINPCYKNGDIAMITNQLGLTFAYDAIKSDLWIEPTYSLDALWINAKECNYKVEKLSERPIKKVEIYENIKTKVCAQGYFIRNKEYDVEVADKMQSDFLSHCDFCDLFNSKTNWFPNEQGLVITEPQNASGVYIVIDLGKESCGYFTIDIDAHFGTSIDISYGEHLDDLRVRSKIHMRCFANHYTCKNGRQIFTHYFKRIAGRYIQLHIRGIKDSLKLFYVGLKPTFYPFVNRGEFVCNDSLYNKIYEVCIDTLKLCAHEHYEDCPWREQALYAADARNQMLFGYYAFGEYKLPKASIELLMLGQRNDGLLNLCAPTKMELTIPSFTCWWIVAVAEYVLFSGDKSGILEYLKTIRKFLSKQSVDIKNGLLKLPDYEYIWNFYEWRDGLDGWNETQQNVNKKEIYEAPYQLIFYMALDKALWLAKLVDEKDFIAKYEPIKIHLKYAINETLWNEDKKLYATYVIDGNQEHYCELVQSLAVCCDICDYDRKNKLIDKLANNEDLVKISLSNSILKIDALMQGDEQHIKYCFEYISELWGNMLYNGATSFWETEKGAEDFDMAGSLCHGWSAVPIYVYFRYILGIYPTSPGFEKYDVKPISPLHQFRGIVPTPYNDIVVDFDSKINDTPKYFEKNCR